MSDASARERANAEPPESGREPRPRLATVVRAVAVALVALSLVQTWQYWNGIIPSEKTTWAQYRASFLRLR
jgi:hypothetical protein